MNPHTVLWPEEIIELNQELASGLHPDLQPYLVDNIGPGYGHDTLFIERLAAIAAYAGVALDGLYDSDQILVICKVITDRLKQMRKRPDDGKPEIILPLH